MQESAPEPASTQEPFLVITSELNAFAHQLITPNVRWFNEDRARAEELADMLLPTRSGISLRLSDHLVVQYSREHVIMVKGDHGGVPTELWLDYRRILGSTGKKFFDVFKRKNAISARLLGTEIQTTVGQITFLCWYQKRGLHEYMKRNEGKVREHMQRVERGASPSASNVTKKGAPVEPAFTRLNPAFKRVSDAAPDDRRKRRKSRAPSRSDSVKPEARVFRGAVEMSYT